MMSRMSHATKAVAPAMEMRQITAMTYWGT